MVFCSDIPDATVTDCSKPWGLDCIEESGFEPHRLWNITLNIWNQCHTDSRLWIEGNVEPTYETASLSQHACEAFTKPRLTRGLHATKYPAQDIWGRLSTWKFPLFQLVASSPRPPLNRRVEGFTLAHLMGDPIGHIRDSLEKLSRCQRQAIYWDRVFGDQDPNQESTGTGRKRRATASHIEYVRDRFGGGMGYLNRSDSEREGRAFAMITISYDEWGQAEEARKVLRNALDQYMLRACIEKQHPDMPANERYENIYPSMAENIKYLAADSDHAKQCQRAFDVVMEKVRSRQEESERRARGRHRRHSSLHVPPHQLRSRSRSDASDQEEQRLIPDPTNNDTIAKPELTQLTTFLRICNQTSDALAADRSTKILPILTAELLFIGAIAIALVKTASDNGATLLINVEAHSIAFSALYFWIIPAVFISSVIGSSQTENSMPAILHRFKVDLIHELPEDEALFRQLPDRKLLGDIETRVANGGVYSWIPRPNWEFNPISSDVSKGAKADYPVWKKTLLETWRWTQFFIPELIVTLGMVFAVTLSATVPPLGWGARTVTQALMFFVWAFNCFLTRMLKRFLPVDRGHNSWCFRITFIKDAVLGIGVMGGIIITQIGIFNRCESYTKWGHTGLALPDQPATKKYLQDSIHSTYITITALGIGLQMFLPPLYIWLKYGAAWEVLSQLDDGTAVFVPGRWRGFGVALKRRDSEKSEIPKDDLEARTFQRKKSASEEVATRERTSSSLQRPIPLQNLSPGRGRGSSPTPIADEFTAFRQSTSGEHYREPSPV